MPSPAPPPVSHKRQESASYILEPAPPLSSSRYNRQLLVPQLGGLTGQQNLLDSRVLIVGLGGLGSPAALYLAGAGIGTLGLMDSDTVETSNLHRQIAHSEDAADRGMSKVASALRSCRALNSSVEYLAYEGRASAGPGLEGLLNVLRDGRFDVVLDCTDNPATRYLISDACVVAGCVLVSGAAQRGEGQLVVLNCPPVASSGDDGKEEEEDKGPCYRCVFPRPPAPEMVRGCGEIGILGHVVGVIGVLMAGEAVKIISRGKHLRRPGRTSRPTDQETGVSSSIGTSKVNGASKRDGQEEPRAAAAAATPKFKPKQQHTMLLYNTFASDPRNQFRTITLRGRRRDCTACGDDDMLASKNLTRITAESVSEGRMDYVAFCGVLEEVKILGEENRVDAGEFLRRRRRRQHEQGRYTGIHGGRETEGEDNHASRGTDRQKQQETENDGSNGLGGRHGHGDGHTGRRKRQSGPRHRHGSRALVVDVREEHEVELGPKIRGSTNIPLSRILRHGAKAFDDLQCARLGRRYCPDDDEDDGDAAGAAVVNIGDGNSNSHGKNDGDGYARGQQSSESEEGMGKGGMVDEESHIPVAVSTTSALRDAYPPQPLPPPGQQRGDDNSFPRRRSGSGTESDDETETEDDKPCYSVYFVCQRGNDSQVAAQKLLERIQAEEEQEDQDENQETKVPTTVGPPPPAAARNARPWAGAWIGDVKGGFEAMERHQFGPSS